MARPDGRAFCALWAQSRRAAAHSGGPRPSRQASASLRPRSGRGPAGGPHGPGLGPALPTRRPRGLVLLTARQEDASPAGWWGLPSAPSGRVPPAPSGQRAATPAHPGRLGRRPPRPPAAVGVLWRLVAACGGSGLRPCGACQPPAVARGHSVGPQGQAPCGGRFAGLAPRQPRAGRGVGAPARPGPHSVGAVGPSAPPARSGLAPASRPALARLRLCPRWCGSACARPARRSGPAPLAASRRQAAGRRPRPLGAARARPQFRRRALGPCPLCGSRPLSAPRAAGARGYAACGRDSHTGAHPARPRQAACGGPCLMISGAAKGDKVTRPAVAGPPAPQPTDDKIHKQ